jgi:capsular exopolysaccharide synthesis family protein
MEKVNTMLTGPDMRQFMAPFEADGGAINSRDILQANRKISQQRGSFIILVQYSHPDPAIAAKVANYFAEAYVAYTTETQIGSQSGITAELKQRVKTQQQKVTELDNGLHDYVVASNMPSIKEANDTITKTLLVAHAAVDAAKSQMDRATNRVNLVDEYIKNGKDLKELPFIASEGAIDGLQKSLATANVELKQMESVYGPKWPDMITKKQQIDQFKAELKKAEDRAVALIRSDYDGVRRDLEAAKAAATDAEERSKKLDEFRVKYEQLERNKAIEAATLQDMNARLVALENSVALDPNPATIVDPAGVPAEDAYVSPNMTVNLSLGAAAGLGLGLIFAFFVAYIDDRVKSSFDIESVVGLPLIGIIPQIKKMEQPDKAQIVANNADRQVSEAFLALHSALRLKDESKNGQCILVTSTIPGEGKSFVTTNLALTFAAHGERVIVIDCDLRKPNVHRSFRLENLKGLIDVIAGGATVDDVMVKQLHPNLDVIMSGGRAKNPTQILNSKKFEIMISELRKRYDRILFDTPPLAAVSDALIILPLMDGSIFSIFFNKVRRKAAQFAAKKLLEANVSVYGVVLNGLNLAVSGYYYAQYYDKSYKDYYVVMSKGENTPPS